MVQELHVLRCYSCDIFQVQIVKKVNKWQCKICNEKQSVQKVYFQGTGEECRLKVQRMNLTKLYKDEEEIEGLKTRRALIIIEENGKEEKEKEKEEEEENNDDKDSITLSKWTKYIVQGIKNDNDNDKKKMKKENFYKRKNLNDNNNFFDSDFSIENCKSENPDYRIAAEYSPNRNSSSSLFISRTNNDDDENNFNDTDSSSERNNREVKRKFDEYVDEGLDIDYFYSIKRIKIDDESLERNKINLRDIIKSNRNKESEKLYDEFNKEDNVINEETLSCKSDVEKKTTTVFQSDINDFDDNFDF